MINRYVLIRGLVRGNGHWGNFLKVLEKNSPTAEIEVFEIPGNGTRCSEKSPTNVIDVITDFRSRSQFVRDKKPFAIVGISLGGMIALKWLEKYPNEIVNAFVINSSLKSLSPFYCRLKFSNYIEIIKILFATSVERRELKILKLTSNQLNLDPQIVDGLIEFSKKYPVKKLNFFRQLILANSIQISKDLRQPIQIVQSVQDRLVDPVCSKDLANCFAARIVSHPTAGHDIALDAPEWLAQQLKSDQ